MKIVLLLGIALVGVTGCSTYQGGVGDESGAMSGDASQLSSPGGLDIARGKNEFKPATNPLDQERPAGTLYDVPTMMEQGVGSK